MVGALSVSARRGSSHRGVCLLWCSCPANALHGPTHGGRTHPHAVFSFPPAAIVLHSRTRMSFQQFLQAHLYRCSFFRGPSWNGPRQNGAGFPSLLHIALNGSSRHLEEIDDLCSWLPFVHRAKHSLPQVL